jgi:type IX secretion system PorP/SprF family membrane protein
MKKVVTLALMILCLDLYGQYLPNNSQVFQFSPIVNPAFSGIENFNDLKLSYRYQWSNFGDFSPKFINLSYNARIKQPLDLSYNSIRISDPSLAQGIPKGKRIIHGLAGHVFQSKIGIINSIGGGVSYALHYPVVNQWRISGGVAAFIENRKLDMNKVEVKDPDKDTYYNHLLNSSTAQTDVNVRAGLLLYHPNFYFGFSYLPLVYTAIQSSDLAFEEAFYKATVQAGISLDVNPQFAIKPSVLALVQIDNSIAFDASVKAYVQNKVWAGLTYRSIKSGVAMVGFNINEKFNAAYSFEMAFGDFQQFSGTSHELVLGMRLNNLKKQNQYTW